jgi:hypothetical protein
MDITDIGCDDVGWFYLAEDTKPVADLWQHFYIRKTGEFLD